MRRPFDDLEDLSDMPRFADDEVGSGKCKVLYVLYIHACFVVGVHVHRDVLNFLCILIID